MRHRCRIPRLNKPADQRKALMRSLTTNLLREGRITTTKARAKAVRSTAEKMIGLAKDGSLAARRQVKPSRGEGKPAAAEFCFLSKRQISG